MRAEGPPDVSKENARKPTGSRSLIRHRLFLQQNLHLNPDGVWLNPCSVRLYFPFESPLFIKYILQLQYSRYPHFHRVSPPARLRCGRVQVRASHSSWVLVWPRQGLQPRRAGGGQAPPWSRESGLQRIWVRLRRRAVAAEHVARWRPRALGCRGEEGDAPRGGAGAVCGTRGCTQRGSGYRRLCVTLTSSKCVSRQKH